MKGVWFSTRIRFAIVIETKGLVRYSDSVYLFRSENFDTAFQSALDAGRKNERAYVNGEGQRVFWKTAEVVSLDIIQAKSLEGAEVYSEPVAASDPSIAVDHKFSPESSKPTQTI